MLAGLFVLKREKRALLKALSDTGKPLSALDLEELTGLWVQNIYPALRDMEREELVTCFSVPGGPERRGSPRYLYRPTRSGKRFAHAA